MIVYRVCKKDEIDILLSEKSFQNLGKICEINKNINTHLYEKAKNYLHFFKDKDSIFYLNTKKDMFICTYNIPDYILEKNIGIGYYLDRYNFTNLEKVSEYAIENKFVNFDHLLKIEKILEYIDIEDYIYDDISSKIETIYIKNEIINQDIFFTNKKRYDILTDIRRPFMKKDITTFNLTVGLMLAKNSSSISFEEVINSAYYVYNKVIENNLSKKYNFNVNLSNNDIELEVLKHNKHLNLELYEDIIYTKNSLEELKEITDYKLDDKIFSFIVEYIKEEKLENNKTLVKD